MSTDSASATRLRRLSRILRERLPAGFLVPPWRRLSIAQLMAVGVGIAAIGFGLWELIVVAPSATRPIAAVAWLAGGLVAHDGVLAPIAVVVGALVVRLVPAPARRWVAVAALALVSLALIAAPEVLRP